MIRIYFDWNVISYLKRTEIEKFQKLRDILKKYEERILIPFTDTHLQDLKKSYKPNDTNEFFFRDLTLLSEIAKNHLLQWETEDKHTHPYKATPEEIFAERKYEWDDPNQIDIANIFNELFSSIDNPELNKKVNELKDAFKNIPIGDNELQKSANKFFGTDNIVSFWDVLNHTAKLLAGLLNEKKILELRGTMKEGIKLDVNHGNWDKDEVFSNIDKILKQSELNMTFDEMLESSEKNFENTDNIFSKFTNTYIQLDLLGYKPDKLKKPGNSGINIINDANHAFYAAHCDYFVAEDINLIKKSKAIYSKNQLPTKVFSVFEFIENEKNIFNNQPNNMTELLEIISNTQVADNLYEVQTIESRQIIAFKTPSLVFDFFNYLIVSYLEDFNTYEYMFKRAFQNYSRFVFYDEIDKLIRDILSVLDYIPKQELISEIKESIENNEEGFILFNEAGIMVVIRKEEYKPNLVIYFKPARK